MSPSLNTTADGSLYLTINDMVRWAIGLNHARVPDSVGLAQSWTPVRLNDGGTYPYGFGWRLDDQRGHPRIGHGGSWQGFRTSIQRYPEYGLTVIALANLDAAMPEVVTTTIAGILEPALLPPHLLPASAEGPPEPIERLLVDLAAGKAQGKLAPGLRTFASKSVREEWGRSIASVTSWENLGCDTVGERGISRLGTSIERICYARGIEADSRLLVSVAYGRDWQPAELDSYEY